MKKHLATLFFITLLLSCGTSESDNPTKEDLKVTTSDSVQSLDTLATLDTLKVTEEIPLFNMHPEPIFDMPADAHIKSASVRFFNAQTNNDRHYEMMVFEDHNDTWSGKYIDISSGELFNISNFKESDSGQITINTSEIDSLNQFIIADHFSTNGAYSGFIISGTDSLDFSATEIKSKAEEREVFMLLSNGSFYNTEEKIVANSEDSSSDNGQFGENYWRTEEGSAYDFGQEWVIMQQRIFFNSNIRFVDVSSDNGESTLFVEGKEPSGPEDTEYEVQGMEYVSRNVITTQFIKDGIVTSKETKVDFEKNANVWILGEFIIFELYTNHDIPTEIVKYKWDDEYLDYFEYI